MPHKAVRSFGFILSYFFSGSGTTFGTKQLSIKFETHNIWKPLSLLYRHWNKIKSKTLINTGIDTPLAKAQNVYYYYHFYYYYTTTNSELRIDLHRPPPPSTSTNLQPPSTFTELRRPPPTSTNLHHRPPPSYTDIRRLPPLPPKDVNAPIYGLVGNRIAFEVIASLNTHACNRVIRNFQNLLCSFYVQSDDESNVKTPNGVGADWQIYLYCCLSGTVMITIESEWYSAEAHSEQGPGSYSIS